MLKYWSREYVRSVTRLLWTEYTSVTDSQRKLTEVYRDAVRRVHALQVVQSWKTVVRCPPRPSHRKHPHIKETREGINSGSREDDFWEKTNQNSRFIHCIGAVNRNCTRCRKRIGIPQGVRKIRISAGTEYWSLCHDRINAAMCSRITSEK